MVARVAVLGTLLVVMLVAAPFAPVRAQPPTQKTMLERLCTADRVLREWFAASFLGRVSFEEVENAFADLRGDFGVCRRADQTGSTFAIVYERGTVTSRIALDPDGRVASLFISPRAAFSSVEQAREAIRSLPGKVSLLLLEQGRDRLSLEPDAHLSVGGSFMLTVLAVLKDQSGTA